MDLWVVAAAAGAGYLAKYWKRLSENGGSSSHLSSEDSNFENPESPRHPFHRRDKLGKVVSLDRRTSDEISLDGVLTTELASKKQLGSDEVRYIRNCNESDVFSVSNLPLSLSGNENFNDIEDENEQSSNIGGNCRFLLPVSSAGEVGSILRHSGNKTSLRIKCGHIGRPLNSIESCLMAQLCNEHAKMEEYVFSYRSSQSMATRSFLVSDGSQIISRPNCGHSFGPLIGSEEYKLHRAAGQVKDKNLSFGIPPLRKIGSFNDAKRIEFQGSGGSGRLTSSKDVFSGKYIHTQHDATFLFSLGTSFGIITSILANKREMDKLKESLKQTENLVQDLQDELEMKDSMTVKELHSENYGSQDTCDHSFCNKEINGFSPEKHMDNSPVTDCKKRPDQKEEGSSESMSKIEAELEAELERLGLNMNESGLDRRLSELVEFDPDFVADFAQGELRTDMVSGKDDVHPKSNEDASDTTNPPVNFAVSPYELSLRLHEVIQSRLEERVQELEIALQNSQRKLELVELEHEHCTPQHFPNRGQTSFTKENQLTYDDCDTLTEPLVMNLSGEALGAYNEAYQELIKMDDSVENSPSGIHDTDHKRCSHSQHALQVQHCGTNGSVTYPDDNVETLSRELSSSEVTILKGQSFPVNELNDVGDDENCDCGYDVDRQLIEQIVERTKKGSPLFQNARRILYSMDEDEH